MRQVIDLRDFSIWMMILSFCKGFALFTIIHSLFKDKYNSFVTLITSLSIFTIWNFANNRLKEYDEFVFSILIYILLAVSIFAVMLISIDGKVKSKIGGSFLIFILYVVIWIGLAAFLSYIYSMFGYSDFIDNSPEYLSTVSLTLSTSLAYLIGGYIVSFFLKLFKIKSDGFNAKYLYFYIFPITNILPIIVISSVSGAEKSNSASIYERPFVTVIFIVTAIVDFSTVFIVDAIKKTDKKNEELLILSAKNEFEYQNLELIKAEQEQLTRIKHDIKNIHLTARQLILSGNTDEAARLLNSSSEELDFAGDLQLCKNEIINTVFYIKRKAAQSNNVKLNVNCDLQNNVKIENIDFARILLNLCDNSINAAKNCENGKVEFGITVTDKLIKISTENPYTEKKNKIEKGHGNGTKIIKEIAKRYGGDYRFECSNAVYKTYTTLRNISTK